MSGVPSSGCGGRAVGWAVLGCGLMLVAGAAGPSRAAACSPGRCSPGSLFIAPGATIPANTLALRWRPPSDAGSQGSGLPEPVPHLARIDGEDEVEVALEREAIAGGQFLLRVTDGWVEGARYRFRVEESFPGCEAPEPLELEVAGSAEVPERLGQPVLGAAKVGEIRVATASGSCDAPLPAAMIDLDLTLAPEAEPWAALLQYTTLVDDQPYIPTWSLGPDEPYAFTGAQTILFAECDFPLSSGLPVDDGIWHDGLAEGAHSVRIDARLPGMDAVLHSEEAAFNLACPEGELDAGSGSDAGRSDAGATSHKKTVASRQTAGAGGSCALREPGASAGGGSAAGAAFAWVLVALRARRSARGRGARVR